MTTKMNIPALVAVCVRGGFHRALVANPALWASETFPAAGGSRQVYGDGADEYLEVACCARCTSLVAREPMKG